MKRVESIEEGKRYLRQVYTEVMEKACDTLDETFTPEFGIKFGAAALIPCATIALGAGYYSLIRAGSCSGHEALVYNVGAILNAFNGIGVYGISCLFSEGGKGVTFRGADGEAD